MGVGLVKFLLPPFERAIVAGLTLCQGYTISRYKLSFLGGGQHPKGAGRRHPLFTLRKPWPQIWYYTTLSQRPSQCEEAVGMPA
jgi:hypothetical protein